MLNERRIEMEGQIWEECDCSNEPVYTPLMVCEQCWPKAEQEEE